MAVYSTFFVAELAELPGAFPGWKLPLPEPVTRKSFHPFLGEEITTTSRSPDWDDVDPDSLSIPDYQVVSSEGDYADYLEQRIPSFVRSKPHWCAKGLTNIEIEALANTALNLHEVSLESVLYAHPAFRSYLMQFPPDFITKLKELGSAIAVEQLAVAFAARMSTTEYTHSVDGERLYEDWTTENARFILEPLVTLAKELSSRQSIFLLIEA